MIWALLIGVNCYTRQRCLEGAVGDVRDMEAFLLSYPTAKPPIVLTATANSSGSEGVVECPYDLPTVENVKEKLAWITSNAQPGDTVYIHYSGHGTRNKKQGHLALALYDETEPVLLSGIVLAASLNKMVKRGLFVTLVLDCCFSGGIKRHDRNDGISVRGFDYDPLKHPPWPDDADALRNSQQITHTLIKDSNSYNVLCACTPHEESCELRVAGLGKRGALSYFLQRALIALREAQTDINHRSLYQAISVRFHAERPTQNPMRYGNKNFSMFGGHLQSANYSLTSVFWTSDKTRLCLRAGNAHGVQTGDEYSIHATESMLDSSTPEPLDILMKVTQVDCLTSDLQLTNLARQPHLEKVKTGWKAKCETTVSKRGAAIHVSEDDFDTEELITASKDRLFVKFDTTGPTELSTTFSLIINKSNELEIVDQLGHALPTLPRFPRGQTGSTERMIDIVEHISAYKYLEILENRRLDPSFSSQFEISFSRSTGEQFTDTSDLNIEHGAELEFCVQNSGQQAAYLHLYDLGPEWQIEAITAQDGGSDFLEIPAQTRDGPGRLDGALRMTVPDSFIQRGQHLCKDVLKFFVTSQPTDLTAFERQRLTNVAQPPKRHLRSARNGLRSVVEQLNAPFRGPAAHRVEHWFASNFIVSTTFATK